MKIPSQQDLYRLGLIEGVVKDNKFKSTWFFGGLGSAILTKIQALFSSKSTAEILSINLNEGKASPATLRWFSDRVIEQVKPSHPLDLAQACASAWSKHTKIALGKAYEGCFTSEVTICKPPK